MSLIPNACQVATLWDGPSNNPKTVSSDDLGRLKNLLLLQKAPLMSIMENL